MTPESLTERLARALYWRDHAPFPWEEVGEVSVIEDYTSMAQCCLTELRASGFAIVPREPTKEMIAAGQSNGDGFGRGSDEDNWLADGGAESIWSAMLAAGEEK